MTIHLGVRKEDAQDLITLLRKEDLLDRRYQVQRKDDLVLIPVTEEPQNIGASYTLVDLEPKESKVATQPRKAGGAFDLMGEIAITKIRNRERAAALAKDLIRAHPNIRSVYLDAGIAGEYRLRELELLEGAPITVTRYRENGIIFELDVSRVYFSPRLATERMFVAKDTTDGESVIDMFAGIGAFSINIAKLRDVDVTAIDSNPAAIEYMEKSISLNHIRGRVHPVHGDSATVMKTLPEADRIIMNLPHESNQYLHIAVSKLKKGGFLHYYEILDMFGLESRMEQFRSLGLEITKKREVHGYSTTLSMYSLTAMKEWE